MKDAVNHKPVSHRRVVLRRLLDRVGSNYPYGLAHAALQSARQRRGEREPVLPLLILVASSGGELSEEETQLLHSIIEKGLHLPVTAVVVKVCSLTEEAGRVAQWWDETVFANRTALVISMGFTRAPSGTWTGSSDEQLHTVSLAEVRSSKDAKRLFWGHIQGVLERLPRMEAG